jgi:hypothetical protein
MAKLIQHYGLYWTEDFVQWKGSGTSEGAKLKGKIGTRKVDFRDARGIYSLYRDFKLIYIGQALGRPLGLRLKEHRKDDKAGRWDTFSWFSLSLLKANDEFNNPAGKLADEKTIIDTLETFGIMVGDPPMNRQMRKIPGALLVQQDIPAIRRTYFEILTDIEKKFDKFK